MDQILKPNNPLLNEFYLAQDPNKVILDLCNHIKKIQESSPDGSEYPNDSVTTAQLKDLITKYRWALPLNAITNTSFAQMADNIFPYWLERIDSKESFVEFIAATTPFTEKVPTSYRSAQMILENAETYGLEFSKVLPYFEQQDLNGLTKVTNEYINNARTNNSFLPDILNLWNLKYEQEKLDYRKERYLSIFCKNISEFIVKGGDQDIALQCLNTITSNVSQFEMSGLDAFFETILLSKEVKLSDELFLTLSSFHLDKLAEPDEEDENDNRERNIQEFTQGFILPYITEKIEAGKPLVEIWEKIERFMVRKVDFRNEDGEIIRTYYGRTPYAQVIFDSIQKHFAEVKDEETFLRIAESVKNAWLNPPDWLVNKINTITSVQNEFEKLFVFYNIDPKEQ